MRIVLDINVEKIKLYHYFSQPFSENRTPYELMWKLSVEKDRPQMPIDSMSIECLIPMLKTHTQNV
jgi:hypothetical protein